MACKRCSMCGINYPTYESTCRVCSTDLDLFSDLDPHSDWHSRVQDALTSADSYNMRTPLPVPDCRRADVVEHEGKLWVPHEHLLREGYACIESFDVVQVEGRFYELQAHVGKHAKNMPGGAWWVEEIDPTAEAERILGSLPVLSDEEYTALQATRRGPDDQGHGA